MQNDVTGYEGLYSVNESGVVCRIDVGPARPIKPWTDKDGYCVVALCKNSTKRNRRVHQLVLEAFVGPCPEGMEVNHVNGIRSDNRLENLEYCTHAENERHARSVLGKISVGAKGESNSHAKLSEGDVAEIRRLLCAGMKQKEIAQQFGISQTAVSRINVGRSWSHCGDSAEAFDKFVLHKED